MRFEKRTRGRGKRIEIALDERLVQRVHCFFGGLVVGGAVLVVVVVVAVVVVVEVDAVPRSVSPAPSASDRLSSMSTVCVIASESVASAGCGGAGAMVSVVPLALSR